MSEQKPESKPKKPKGPPKRTEYVVFKLNGAGELSVIGARGAPGFPEKVPTISARTPEEAREIAFEKLTDGEPEEKRDAYAAELIALAARGWSYEKMAWTIKREVKRA